MGKTSTDDRRWRLNVYRAENVSEEEKVKQKTDGWSWDRKEVWDDCAPVSSCPCCYGYHPETNGLKYLRSNSDTVSWSLSLTHTQLWHVHKNLSNSEQFTIFRHNNLTIKNKIKIFPVKERGGGHWGQQTGQFNKRKCCKGLSLNKIITIKCTIRESYSIYPQHIRNYTPVYKDNLSWESLLEAFYSC